MVPPDEPRGLPKGRARGRLAIPVAETNTRMEEAPRPQQTDARRRGPVHGVGKRLNTLTRRVEYKIEIVGVWIDPASAQKSWDNLRAAVAQQNKLRAAQNKVYSSWQEGSTRESQEWDDDLGAGDPKCQEDQNLAKNTQQAGTGSAQRDSYQADVDPHPTPQGGTPAAPTSTSGAPRGPEHIVVE